MKWLNIIFDIKKIKTRISLEYGFMIVLVALFFDALVAIFNLIPVVGGFLAGWPLGLVNWVSMFFLFNFKGIRISFLKNKKMAVTGIIAVIWGLIPILNALPEFTVAAARIVILSWEDDLEVAKKSAAATKQQPKQVITPQETLNEIPRLVGQEIQV